MKAGYKQQLQGAEALPSRAAPTWHMAHGVVVPVLVQGQAGQEVQPHQALQQVMDAIDAVAVQVDVAKLVLDPVEGHQTCRGETRDITAQVPARL